MKFNSLSCAYLPPCLIPSLLSVLLMSACADKDRFQESAVPTGPSHASSDANLDRLPSDIRPEEDTFASLSRLVSSSAGYYIDPDGTTVVQVRDSNQFGLARQAFGRVRPPNHDRFTNGQIRIQKADYSFAQRATWRDKIFDGILSQGINVVLLDMDEARNRVVIGIRRAGGATSVEEVLREVVEIGIEKDAIIVETADPLAPSVTVGRDMLTTRRFASPDLQNGPWPSLVGGVMVSLAATDPFSPAGGLPGSCTLGFTAYYTPPSGSSYRAAVTAGHCTSWWGSVSGQSLYLTNLPMYGGVVAGTETVDPDHYMCGINHCRASDAALFQVDAGMPYELGLIARPYYGGSLTQDIANPWFVVNGTIAPPSGAPYSRVGRASGWISGIVTSTCVDLWLNNWASVRIARCSDAGNAQTTGGDSGGSVFAMVDSFDVRLMGTTVGNMVINGASRHVWSPYSRIASDMGGSMNVVRPATLTAVTPTGSTTGMPSSQAIIAWPLVSGATEYMVHAMDFAQTCDPYWGCSIYQTGGYRTTVTTTYHTDTRNIFSSIIPPGTPGTFYTSFSVEARNRLTGERSLVTNEVNISH